VVATIHLNVPVMIRVFFGAPVGHLVGMQKCAGTGVIVHLSACVRVCVCVCVCEGLKRNMSNERGFK
jgi:hypothetical protein